MCDHRKPVNQIGTLSPEDHTRKRRRRSLSKTVPYLSVYTAHFFALKIRAKSWVRGIRRYPLSRAEFEYCADIYQAQYTRVLSAMLGNSRADVLYVQDVSAEGAETARLYPSVLRSVYAGAVVQTQRGKWVSAYIAHPQFCLDFQGKKVRGIHR